MKPPVSFDFRSHDLTPERVARLHRMLEERQVDPRLVRRIVKRKHTWEVWSRVDPPLRYPDGGLVLQRRIVRGGRW